MSWALGNILVSSFSSLGPSKSLTFEEGVGTLGESLDNPDGSTEPKKVPDPCCPIICERM